MVKLRALVSIGILIGCLGCGGGTVPPGAPAGSGSWPTAQPDISISPASVSAGSGDTTITIIASHGLTFTSGGHKFNQAIWSQNGSNTNLTTTFVSSSQLTATIPAPLLMNPVQAKVRVEIWDIQGDAPEGVSSSVTFSVTAPGSGAPSITSISPSAVAVGGPDLAITITGLNFDNQFLHQSIAFLTTDPHNLHDHGTMLNTTFVSSTELTAVIPASLLQEPASVQIVVLTGDSMGMSDGYFGYPESNAVAFTVTP